jgi:hypothetical protein
MLSFGRQQFLALGQGPQQRFVTELAARLTRFWPEEAAAFGPARTLEVTQQAVQRALALGFESELDVARFAHLVFALHSLHFMDQDWARPYLQGPQPPRVRMNRLFDAAIARLTPAQAPTP